MPKPSMRETDDWSALEKTMMLSDEDRNRIASRFDIEPTNEAIEQRIAGENRLIEAFHERFPTFNEDTEKTIAYMAEQYDLNPDDCATVEVVGAIECYSQIKDTPGAFRYFGPVADTPYGIHDTKYDQAYLIASDEMLQWPISQVEHAYLHEFLHGAGHVYGTTEDTVKRGFKNNEVDEGIVDYIASRYALSAESDTAAGEKQHRQFREIHPYRSNVRLVQNLARHVSEKLIMDGYFHGKTDELRAEIENVYGPGAYELFFENPEYSKAEDLEVLAANWKECVEYLRFRQDPQYKISPNEVNKETMDSILKSHFNRTMRSDFQSYRQGKFGKHSTEEGKTAAMEKIRQLYNDDIVNIFVKYYNWMESFHEGEIAACNDFVTQAIEKAYKQPESTPPSI